MPERATIWRINMCINNIRAIALIQTFDGSIKLLQMTCLQTPKILKWSSVFKPWWTVVKGDNIIGIHGSGILAVQIVNLVTGKVEQILHDKHKYRAINLIPFQDNFYAIAMKTSTSDATFKP